LARDAGNRGRDKNQLSGIAAGSPRTAAAAAAATVATAVAAAAATAAAAAAVDSFVGSRHSLRDPTGSHFERIFSHGTYAWNNGMQMTARVLRGDCRTLIAA
jgi:membrane protein involved in colicin uptake